jgi:hypothetical protein
VAALAQYLRVVHQESVRRGYHFEASKIGTERFRGAIAETNGQLLYEWEHLKRKLAVRDAAQYRACHGLAVPEAHPLFRIVRGGARDWEKRR